MGLNVDLAKHLLYDILDDMSYHNEILKRKRIEIPGYKLMNDWNQIDENIIYANELCIQYQDGTEINPNTRQKLQYEVHGHCVKYYYDESIKAKILYLWDNEMIILRLFKDQPCTVTEYNR